MITILKFYADWCGPCNALKPTWDKIQEDLSDEFIFQAVDIEANPQTRAEFYVRTIPMFIAVQDGKEIARKQGASSYTELKDWLYEQRNLQRDLLQE